MNEIEYLIFEDKGVVVCKIWGCEDAAIEEIRKKIGLGCVCTESYKINNVYLGIAKCCSEDDFDLEYGKRLALSKAEQRKSKDINNTIKAYITDMKRFLRELEGLN